MDRFEQRVAELIVDTSFIKYCLGQDEPEAAVWETRLLTQPELRPAVKEAARRVSLIREGAEAVEMEAGLEKLRSAVQDLQPLSGKEVAPVYRSPRRRIFRVAAAVLLLTAGAAGYRMGWWGAEKQPEPVASGPDHIVVPAGERKSLSLPDGTTVLLNGGSELVLTEGFNTTRREVKLRGEAYFNVRSDARKPFVIHTAAMNIKVLGTAFNVRSYPDEATDATSLIQGKIEVTLTGNVHPVSRYVLQPMQKIVVERLPRAEKAAFADKAGKKSAQIPVIHLDSLLKNRLVEGFTETAWTEHTLVFYDETLEQAALRIEKWFGVSVYFEKDALRKVKYTGTFENEPLEKVLEIIKLSIPGLKYRVNGGKVYLY